MHKFTLPPSEIARSIANRGMAHPFGTFRLRKNGAGRD